MLLTTLRPEFEDVIEDEDDFQLPSQVTNIDDLAERIEIFSQAFSTGVEQEPREPLFNDSRVIALEQRLFSSVYVPYSGEEISFDMNAIDTVTRYSRVQAAQQLGSLFNVEELDLKTYQALLNYHTQIVGTQSRLSALEAIQRQLPAIKAELDKKRHEEFKPNNVGGQVVIQTLREKHAAKIAGYETRYQELLQEEKETAQKIASAKKFIETDKLDDIFAGKYQAGVFKPITTIQTYNPERLFQLTLFEDHLPSTIRTINSRSRRLNNLVTAAAASVAITSAALLSYGLQMVTPQLIEHYSITQREQAAFEVNEQFKTAFPEDQVPYLFNYAFNITVNSILEKGDKLHTVEAGVIRFNCVDRERGYLGFLKEDGSTYDIPFTRGTDVGLGAFKPVVGIKKDHTDSVTNHYWVGVTPTQTVTLDLSGSGKKPRLQLAPEFTSRIQGFFDGDVYIRVSTDPLAKGTGVRRIDSYDLSGTYGLRETMPLFPKTTFNPNFHMTFCGHSSDPRLKGIYIELNRDLASFMQGQFLGKE
jgi:hypothetical protein